VKHGGISDRLRPKVIAGCDTLDAQLRAKLGALTFTVRDLYLLPGRQLAPAGTGIIGGASTDDVTVVVQF
jgi:hypothetical protein